MELQTQVDTLQADLERRQESYIRRERQYKARIEELENSVLKLRDDRRTAAAGNCESKMENIRGIHRTIINCVEEVQGRTAKVLQEQEKDLLRAFRARLFDVQTELEKEKSKSDDGASAWIEKSKQLEAEVDWSKEMTDRLDRLNQSLTRENSRLKNQFTTQENDREFLVHELVAVKKDNARLRTEYERIKTELEQSSEEDRSLYREAPRILSASTTCLPKAIGQHTTAGRRPTTAAAAGSQSMNPGAEADNRYKEIIKRLKRLLETERRNLRQIRASYSHEMEQKTELELFLKQCIDDVKIKISECRGGDPKAVELKEFEKVDREKVMELLLSQERVINLLYAKTFPVHPGSNNKSSRLSKKLNTGEMNQNIIME